MWRSARRREADAAEEVGAADERSRVRALRVVVRGSGDDRSVAHGRVDRSRSAGYVLIVLEVDEDRVDALMEQAEADRPSSIEADKIGYALDAGAPRRSRRTSKRSGSTASPTSSMPTASSTVARTTRRSSAHHRCANERFALEDELEAEIEMEGSAERLPRRRPRSGAEAGQKPGDAKATLAIIGKANTLADVRTRSDSTAAAGRTSARVAPTWPPCSRRKTEPRKTSSRRPGRSIRCSNVV